MKSMIQAGLLVFVITMIFNDCESNTDFGGNGKFAKIYMPQATSYPAERSLIMADSVQTIIYGADYGGPNYPGRDVKVHFSIDTTLVDSFNVANGTNYKVMPKEGYEFSKPNAVIPKGEISTDPLDLIITTIGAIQANTYYLLPVSIETDNDIQINKDLQTTYYLIKGYYKEFDRTGWSIFDVDSEQDGFPASNTLDGNTGTFWHTMYSPQRPPLPHHMTIDMGESHKLHGLRIIGREGFTRGDPEKIVISASSKGQEFVEGETFTTKFNTQNEQTFYLSTTQEGQYFKLTVTDSYGFDDPPITHIAEVYAF